MRIIKFRAWDKENNKWANLNQLADWDSCEMNVCVNFENKEYPYQTIEFESDDKYEFMQSTGLTDKNGKEIYEGDIVGEKDFYQEVISKNGAFRIKADDTPLQEWLWKRERQNEVDKVLGNIYENKELMK